MDVETDGVVQRAVKPAMKVPRPSLGASVYRVPQRASLSDPPIIA